MLYRVEHGIGTVHERERFRVAIHVFETLGFHAQHLVWRHCLVMGAAGDDAVHKCELLGVSMLLAKKTGLDLKNAQNSVAIYCHSVHYTVGILHVLRHSLIVAQCAVRFQNDREKLQREHVIAYALHLLPARQHSVERRLVAVLPQIYTSDVGTRRQSLYGVVGCKGCLFGLFGIVKSLCKASAICMPSLYCTRAESVLPSLR